MSIVQVFRFQKEMNSLIQEKAKNKTLTRHFCTSALADRLYTFQVLFFLKSIHISDGCRQQIKQRSTMSIKLMAEKSQMTGRRNNLMQKVENMLFFSQG